MPRVDSSALQPGAWDDGSARAGLGMTFVRFTRIQIDEEPDSHRKLSKFAANRQIQLLWMVQGLLQI
jgi:hypothetical protein